jgi:hypothetical protein
LLDDEFGTENQAKLIAIGLSGLLLVLVAALVLIFWGSPIDNSPGGVVFYSIVAAVLLGTCATNAWAWLRWRRIRDRDA